MVCHYEDVPISAYKKWIEYVSAGLARSYYSQENIRKMEEERWKKEMEEEWPFMVKKNENNGQ